MNTLHRTTLVVALSCGCLVGASANAHDGGTTRSVANNGTDSPTCGSAVNPCRSISQAISNANRGDTILVGPGRYGDLNFNGVLGEAGEEPVHDPCFCVIRVSKRLNIISERGAAETIIDIGGLSGSVVNIEASRAQFGQRFGGFTVTGSQTGGGITVSADEGVVVSGNIAVANGGTYAISLTRGTGHRVVGNLSTNNGHGFGIFVGGSVIRNNVAVNNLATGFTAQGENNLFERNVADGNAQAGITVDRGNQVFRRNSVLGNRYYGVFVGHDATGIVLEKNNIHGNGASPLDSINCGLGTADTAEVMAVNNFWGSPSGPGEDPADQICGAGAVTVTPFATREFPLPDAAATHAW